MFIESAFNPIFIYAHEESYEIGGLVMIFTDARGIGLRQKQPNSEQLSKYGQGR